MKPAATTWLVGLLMALGMLLIGFFLLRTKERDAHEVGTRAAVAEPPAVEVFEAARGADIAAFPPAPVAPERADSDSIGGSLRLLIRNVQGEPISQASVSLHDLDATVSAPTMPATDASGSAILEWTFPADAGRMGLWITHPAHHARAVVVNALDETGIVELVPASTRMVRVVDATGLPVSGAEVVQAALPARLVGSLGVSSFGDGSKEFPAWMLPRFERTHLTDDAGEAGVHPCSFPVLVQARSKGRSSAQRVMHPLAATIELSLLEPASALGTVHAPPGFAAFAELRVDALQRPIDAIHEGGLTLLATATVAADASWGPLELPLDEAAMLVFRLHGGGLVPIAVSIDPRASDPPFVVDFRGELGERFDAFVFRRDGEAIVGIEGAHIDFRWRDVESQRVLGVSARTDADGRTTLEGCKSTTGTARASAVGFAGARISPVALPRSVPLEIELVPGGTVAGICRSAAGPVEDFDVLIWEHHASRHSLHVFRAREDGSFLVEGAPFGRVQVMAVPAELPESAVETVEVAASAVAQVVLEVPEAVVGRGRVVDAETHAPVPSARIVPLVSSATQILGERGVTFGVDADGRFEIRSFAQREATVWVEADGYARSRVNGSYAAEQGIEFGEIQLARAGVLTVRIRSAEGFDSSFLWFRSDGDNPIAYVRMPPEGELEIEGVQAGRHELNLVWPEGNKVTRWVDLVPGRPWIEEFELSPGEEIAVDVVAPEGVELLPDTGLFATFYDSKNVPVIRAWFVPPDGHLVLTDCAADEVWLEVVDPEGRLIGFSHAIFQRGAARHVAVHLTDRTLAVQVVDGEGAPLPDCRVSITSTDERQPYGINQAADGDGRCFFRGLEADSLIVNAQHPVHGQRTELLELEPHGTTEAEVVLTGTADLHVRLLDGDVRLQGVSVKLFGTMRSLEMGARLTNSDGLATWARRSEGDFQVHVDHQGVWPTWSAIAFTADPAPIDVQVRRLGDAHVQVVDPQGLALMGVGMELTSLEFGETVSAWAAARRVVVENGVLETDVHGEVRVKGLPNGAYRLDVVTPAGATVQQQVVVPPVDTLRHLLVLE